MGFFSQPQLTPESPEVPGNLRLPEGYLAKLLLGTGAMSPGPVGDVLGPVADAHMYYTDPSSRTWSNYGMSALGALPFVPSLATAFHGSPHFFDAFDMSKVGTGEGKQMFGHGLYMAENKDIGKGYKKTTSYQNIKNKFLDELPEDADFQDIYDLMGTGYFTPEQERLFKALDDDGWLGFDYPSQAISAVFSKDFTNMDPSPELVDALDNIGHLYEVDIPDEALSKMLDWDNEVAAGKTGKQIYKELSDKVGPQAASELLKKHGFTGIKYLDSGSRKAGEGTRNFVLFDDKLPTIKKRNEEEIYQPLDWSDPFADKSLTGL
jgi:hypothetical protein